MYYTHGAENMVRKLSDNENDFIKKMSGIYSDSMMADELTRIRYSIGEKDRVTIDQVRKSRYKQNIKKTTGSGKCLREKKRGT